jgi:drug/metabolite transporter (DMT)-like permease
MTERKTHLDGIAIASLVLCCALWGLNQVATKLALAEIGPLTQAGMRSLGAAVLVAAWSRWRGISLSGAGGIALPGLFAGVVFAAEFAFIFIGLQYTSASRMIVFVYTAPFVVALGMPLISRSERLGPLQMLGLVAAFAGVAWAFAEGFGAPGVGSKQWLGDSMGVAAAVTWGAATLLVRATRLASAAPEKTLFWQLWVSGLLLGAAAWAVGEPLPLQARASAWWLLGYQTVIVCFASYLLWFWLVRHYPATRVASFTLLAPLFGLLAGVLLLGEPLTPRLLVAAAAVCGGIALVNRARR